MCVYEREKKTLQPTGDIHAKKRSTGFALNCSLLADFLTAEIPCATLAGKKSLRVCAFDNLSAKETIIFLSRHSSSLRNEKINESCARDALLIHSFTRYIMELAALQPIIDNERCFYLINRKIMKYGKVLVRRLLKVPCAIFRSRRMNIYVWKKDRRVPVFV